MRKRAGVIGWPVSHSLSPKLHRYWLKHYDIEGDYVPLAVEPAALEETVSTLSQKGFCGLNVTVPHKETVMTLLDTFDAEAQAIGAVNTIVAEDGELHGRNTDAYGFAQNIHPYLPEKKKKVVVLGAGGAARAVLHALIGLGFSHVIITNRTLAKAEVLAKRIPGTEVLPWEERSKALADADLLVNTTSLGLMGEPPLEIDLTALPMQAVVTDIVYKPLMTPLLIQAKARGNTVVDGLGMLMHQGVPGFEAWFGIRPEVTPELRRHLLEAA